MDNKPGERREPNEQPNRGWPTNGEPTPDDLTEVRKPAEWVCEATFPSRSETEDRDETNEASAG
jgi:hypothetical protein